MCLPPSGREDLSVEADGRLGTAAPRACAAAAPASDDTSQRRSRVVGALAPRPETYVLFLFLHLVFPHLVFESCSSLLAIWFSWQRLTEAGSRRCGGCCHLTKKGWRLPRGRSRKTTPLSPPVSVREDLGSAGRTLLRPPCRVTDRGELFVSRRRHSLRPPVNCGWAGAGPKKKRPGCGATGTP